MSNLLAAAKAREAHISGVHIEVTGTLVDSPARFAGIDLLVTADTADHDSLEKLVEIADRACVMMNTLRGKLDMTIRAVAPVSITR